MTPPLRALREDRRGVALIEFALIAPVLLLLVMGLFDLAHRFYAQSVLQGELQKAGRDSTLESGGLASASAALDAAVTAQVFRVTGNGSTFDSDRLTYSDFSQVGQAERFSDDLPENNRYDLGECFEDMNGNGRWDADMGRSGQGGAEDAVLYRVTITYPRLFPMAGLLGWPENQAISATTVLRNQPFGTQNRPAVTACA